MNWSFCLTVMALSVALQLPREGPLAMGGTLEGRIFSATGEPAAGVRVAAMEVADETDPDAPATMAGLARTDEQGNYRLDDLPPGRYRLAAGEVENLQYHPDIVTLVAGGSIPDLNLTLANAFGVIETRVHLAGRKEPVANAIVNVRSVSTGHLRSAVTDESGVVSMKGIEYGAYRVSTPVTPVASAVRDLGRDPALAPLEVRVTIDVTPEQPIWNVTLGLLRPASVRGVVRDAGGTPVEGARVASLSVGYRFGRRTLTLENSAVSDATGAYQLTTGLGERYIRVDPPSPSMQGHAVTFAPRAGEPGNADPLLLSNAAAVDGIDIVLSPTARVSGRVRDVPVDGVVESLVFVSRSNVEYAVTLPNLSGVAGGEFVVAGVPQGAWTMFAVVNSDPLRIARASVDIDDKDVEGIEAVRGSFDISGRVIFQGEGDGGTPSITLVAREHVPGILGQSLLTGSMAPDGAFRFEGVPPLRYGVQVSGLGPGWYVADIRVAGQTVFDDAVISDGLQSPGNVEIVVARGTGRLEGRAVFPDSVRLDDARVVLVPDEPHRNNPLLYRVAAVRQDGSFTALPEPAPGNYRLFAIPNLPGGGAELDPAFLQRHEASAMPVTISPGETATVEIRY